MIAVVLVGGKGTRLRPLTYTTPKQMLPVGGRPMLEAVVAGLAGHGVELAVLSLGFLPDAFTDAYPGGVCAGVELAYAVEPEPLDTAGAVAFAAAGAGIDETFVVVNGDVLTDLDLSSLVGWHRRHGGVATIALTPVEDPSSYGVVVTDVSGRVEAFVEKPPAGSAPSNQINAGTYVLEPAALAGITPGRRASIERETFPALAAGGGLFARSSSASWIDAGTPATYLQANLRHAGPPHPSARVHPGAVVERSVVGPGASVGAGAVVTASLLMAGSAVGEAATVSGSIVGPGAQVGPGASLGGLCVLGDGAVVAAGDRLAGALVPFPT